MAFNLDHSRSPEVFHVGRSMAEHVKGLGVLEQETVQLSAGEGAFAVRNAIGRDLVLFQNRIAPKMTGHVVIDRAWITFMLPISWRGDYLFNGIAARPGDIFMSFDPSGYVTLGECRDVLSIMCAPRCAHMMLSPVRASRWRSFARRRGSDKPG